MTNEAVKVVFLSDRDRNLLRTLLVEYLGLVSQLLADVADLEKTNGQVPSPEFHQRVKNIPGHIRLAVEQHKSPTYVGLSMLAPTILWGDVAEQIPIEADHLEEMLLQLGRQANIPLDIRATHIPELDLALVKTVWQSLSRAISIMSGSIDTRCSLI